MGRRPDDRPRVEVLGSDGGDAEVRSETEVTTAHPRLGRSGGALLGLGVAAVLAVLVATTGGGGSDPPTSQPEADPPAPAQTATSEVVEPAGPTEAFLQEAPEPVFGPGVDATVLMGSAERGWRTLELGSGRVREVDELDGVEPQRLHPVTGGVLVVTPGAQELHRVELPDARSRTVSIELRTPELTRVQDLVGAGPDLFWVISWSFTRSGSPRWFATLIGADGVARSDAVELPAGGAVAGTRRGLVYDAGGRVSLVGLEGTSDLGAGTPLAAWGDEVASLSCEVVTTCAVVLHDLGAGTSIGLEPVPSAAAARGRDGFTAAIAGDGSLAIVPLHLADLPWGRDRGGALSTTLTVVRPGGAPTDVVVQSPEAGLAWLPDAQGVLMLTGRGLVRFQAVDGQLVESSAPALRPAGETSILVIPSS